MSQENVETFRAGEDAINRGDLEAALDLVDPEVVFEPLRAPVSGAYYGPDGIRKFFADTADSFDRFRVEHRDIRDLGDDRVLRSGPCTHGLGKAAARQR